MYAQKGSVEPQGAKANYGTIVSKLRTAIARHKAAFPHLAAIEDFLSVSMPDTDKDRDYLLRLEELCSFLDRLSTGSYVIRHLHNNLCSDVEAARSGLPVGQDTPYIHLPG
ncbi:hypothetical protein ACFSC6_10335 [Rufibacter sediminis]|uniref:Uncharacterized protein n=1 Tax=Rufibacter sediminis TaxID=2762756 RepID=A0ABR6VP18_9BACT|nr:hypothetical protein [Rufibacter sediminis]MBC3538934.1 hypothetical protein [Rufibacter sediminis]